jgi:predicted ATPase
VNVRNRYLVITASGPDVILSVCIQCVTNLDGLVFDELAVQDIATVPSEGSSWGQVKEAYSR